MATNNPVSKARLANLATPDIYIASLRSSNPPLHQAITNLGTASQQLINNTFPSPPSVGYKGRIILPGTWTVSSDVLSHRYHVALPVDPTGYWSFTQINLTNCYITAKILASTGPFSVDVLVSQQKGTTPFKSLFKPGFNPIVPAGVTYTQNVMFAINNLFQDDLGRVDILASDGIAADIEVVLIGNYSLTENQIS
jgi:hypothetical protein